MEIRPFACVRPAPQLAARVAALPYDVYDRAEAAAAARAERLSFLNIDRPETQFPPERDMYAPEVYAKARALLDAQVADGTYVEDPDCAFYLYRLTWRGRAQTGFVACCPLGAFLDGTVKRHENTRPEKVADRTRHIEALDAQTGPAFLAFRGTPALDEIAARACADEPLYDFEADDGVRHTVWRVGDPAEVAAVGRAFAEVPCAYIADGHHRTAAAVDVGRARCASEGAGDAADGDPGAQGVLSVLFPADQLAILPYNRVVRDLAGHDVAGFVSELCRAGFLVTVEDGPVEPEERGVFGLFAGNAWWRLTAPERLTAQDDPVRRLDASILQKHVLGPLLGIDDPRTSDRVAFVGGIRGTAELERLVREGTWAAAFSMHPTSIDELFAVADAGLLMPPKSTWFEPKLRSGLFIHRI